MVRSDKGYNEAVNGEIMIIREELDNLCHAPYTPNLDIFPIIENIRPHLFSIEQKIGKPSIDHVNISTEIVAAISHRMLAYINTSYYNSIIDKLSVQETVEFYANQRNNLMEALRICKELEGWNMNYAYRIKNFNVIKNQIEVQCQQMGIDTRSSIQKSVDQFKTVGKVTEVVAKETAGCAIELAIKVAIIIVIFLILGTIIGVK